MRSSYQLHYVAAEVNAAEGNFGYAPSARSRES